MEMAQTTWLALSMVFRGLRWKASPPQTHHSPLKGPVVLGVLRCKGTKRHDAVPHWRVLPELGPKISLHRYNWLRSCVLKHTKSPPLFPSAPFSPNLLTWRPVTKLSVRDNLESSSYMWVACPRSFSHSGVPILRNVSVIMNNPVWTKLATREIAEYYLLLRVS
jgi:hypothetical protein